MLEQKEERDAVNRALDEMPEDFEIRQFLIGNRAEVTQMCITDYNEVETMPIVDYLKRSAGLRRLHASAMDRLDGNSLALLFMQVRRR